MCRLDDNESSESDEDLVQLICAGSEEALLRLVVDRYGGLIRAIGAQFRYSDDLIQDVCVQLFGEGDWKRLRTWNGSAPMSSWLATVAKRICLSHFRKNSSHEGRFARLIEGDDPEDVSGSAPLAEIVRLERWSRVLSAIDRLEERERAIILRCVLGGESTRAVAESLRISEVHLRQIKRRAIVRLAELLREGSDDV